MERRHERRKAGGQLANRMLSHTAGLVKLITAVLMTGAAIIVLLLAQSRGGPANDPTGLRTPPLSATPSPAAPPVPLRHHPGTSVPDVGVSGFTVDGEPVRSGQQVTVTGPVAARVVAGRFSRAAPPGDRFFLLTTPLAVADAAKASSFLQGQIHPMKDRRWSVIAGIGQDGSYPAVTDRVSVILASPSVAKKLAGYEGKPGTLRPVPKMAWRVLARVSVLRRPDSQGISEAVLPPDVEVSGLSVDGRQVPDGQLVTVTGPAAARRVRGQFLQKAPSGDRFFALTAPLEPGSTSATGSYVQGEITAQADGSWEVTVGIGKDGSYPAVPDRVTILLATPSVASTLAGFEGKPGMLRPIPPNLTWRTLATFNVTRQPGSPGGGSPGVPPDVGVTGLTVDGQPVTAGQPVTVSGPTAARVIAGQFGKAAPHGDRFFLLTTPLASADPSTDSSFVQGEISPAGDLSWSQTAGIGKDGSYPAVPDRVTILLATPSVASTLAGFEGKPGMLRPIPPNLTWRTLATFNVTRQPAAAVSQEAR